MYSEHCCSFDTFQTQFHALVQQLVSFNLRGFEIIDDFVRFYETKLCNLSNALSLRSIEIITPHAGVEHSLCAEAAFAG